MVGMHTGSGNPCVYQSQLSRVKRSPKKSFHLVLNWMAEASPRSFLACISIVNKWFCLIFQLLCSSCNHQQTMISQKLRSSIWLLLCHLICREVGKSWAHCYKLLIWMFDYIFPVTGMTLVSLLSLVNFYRVLRYLGERNQVKLTIITCISYYLQMVILSLFFSY